MFLRYEANPFTSSNWGDVKRDSKARIKAVVECGEDLSMHASDLFDSQYAKFPYNNPPLDTRLSPGMALNEYVTPDRKFVMDRPGCNFWNKILQSIGMREKMDTKEYRKEYMSMCGNIIEKSI